MLAALEMTGIRKSFGGFLALDNAAMEARFGEVHALLGENGAGKSSLMNVASGLYSPDAGTIRIAGADLRLSGPRDATHHGIGMIHQHFKLVKRFTVAENILLANPRGPFSSGMAAIEREIRQKAAALGFGIDPSRRVESLSVAEQQRVEIIKVLVAGARILILDEPTAVLTEDEAGRLLATIRDIALGGAAVILVTHKLRDVKAFAHRVTVMRGGRTVATLDPSQTTTDELTTLTVGSNVVVPNRSSKPVGDLRLIVRDLACGGTNGYSALVNASFSVRAGEIYGIAGVGGNGQTELAAALVGGARPSAGRIELRTSGADATRDMTAATPRQRLDLGLASIPADRQALALSSSLSVADNYAIGHVHKGRFGSWFRMARGAMEREAGAAVEAFEVLGVRSLSQRAGLLSGGNAQKLVLAREFSRSPSIIVTHSPSRGLDARACAAVQQRLIGARDTGVAIILISEDLDEVLSISDRIGVMTRGRIVAEFDCPADRHAVGKAMVDHA
jgi:ABC-type uncharacterized transport system ATPase subunit